MGEFDAVVHHPPQAHIVWHTRLVLLYQRDTTIQRAKGKGKGREGKGREGKGREGKGREGKGREGKGREGKGKERESKGGKGLVGNCLPDNDQFKMLVVHGVGSGIFPNYSRTDAGKRRGVSKRPSSKKCFYLTHFVVGNDGLEVAVVEHHHVHDAR